MKTTQLKNPVWIGKGQGTVLSLLTVLSPRGTCAGNGKGRCFTRSPEAGHCMRCCPSPRTLGVTFPDFSVGDKGSSLQPVLWARLWSSPHSSCCH